jgi:iron complex transport system permease protein
MKRPVAFYMLLIMASIFLFFFLNLVLGSVSIPLRAVWNILWGTGNESVIWQNIIWKSRVPQALTALAAGAGLSVSGLQMQTVFRNPLAGPSVLGISSGASMGVAFVVLLSGSLGGVALSKLGFMGEIALTIAAIAGSLSIMALIVFVSQKVRGNVTLLIIGVMIGYIANAVIGVLKLSQCADIVQDYMESHPQYSYHYFENISTAEEYHSSHQAELKRRVFPYFSLMIIFNEQTRKDDSAK